VHGKVVRLALSGSKRIAGQIADSPTS